MQLLKPQEIKYDDTGKCVITLKFKVLSHNSNRLSATQVLTLSNGPMVISLRVNPKGICALYIATRLGGCQVDSGKVELGTYLNYAIVLNKLTNTAGVIVNGFVMKSSRIEGLEDYTTNNGEGSSVGFYNGKTQPVHVASLCINSDIVFVESAPVIQPVIEPEPVIQPVVKPVVEPESVVETEPKSVVELCLKLSPEQAITILQIIKEWDNV